MDRFIGTVRDFSEQWQRTLKSNMDRFIVVKYGDTTFKREALKSNMDRFIVMEPNSQLSLIMFFKIQYG